jgi:hypothetical protein
MPLLLLLPLLLGSAAPRAGEDIGVGGGEVTNSGGAWLLRFSKNCSRSPPCISSNTSTTCAGDSKCCTTKKKHRVREEEQINLSIKNIKYNIIQHNSAQKNYHTRNQKDYKKREPTCCKRIIFMCFSVAKHCISVLVRAAAPRL